MILLVGLFGCHAEPVDPAAVDAVVEPERVAASITVFGQTAAVSKFDEHAPDDTYRIGFAECQIGAAAGSDVERAIAAAVGEPPGQLVVAFLYSTERPSGRGLDHANLGGLFTLWYDASRYDLGYGAPTALLTLPGVPGLSLNFPGTAMDVSGLEARIHSRTSRGYGERLRDTNTGDPTMAVFETIADSVLPEGPKWITMARFGAFPKLFMVGGTWDHDLADALFENPDAWMHPDELVRRVPDVLVPDAPL